MGGAATSCSAVADGGASPLPKTLAAMFYSPSAGRVFLLGGRTPCVGTGTYSMANDFRSTETTTWDADLISGITATNGRAQVDASSSISIRTTPGAMAAFGAAWDEINGLLFVFGGAALGIVPFYLLFIHQVIAMFSVPNASLYSNMTQQLWTFHSESAVVILTECQSARVYVV